MMIKLSWSVYQNVFRNQEKTYKIILIEIPALIK